MEELFLWWLVTGMAHAVMLMYFVKLGVRYYRENHYYGVWQAIALAIVLLAFGAVLQQIGLSTAWFVVVGALAGVGLSLRDVRRRSQGGRDEPSRAS